MLVTTFPDHKSKISDSTHLNFFKGFEYDPTPELEAMADGCAVERREGANSGGVEIKNARRHRTADSSRNRKTERTRRVQWQICQGQSSKRNAIDKSKSGQLKRAVDLGKQTWPPPPNGAVNPLRATESIPPPPTPIRATSSLIGASLTQHTPRPFHSFIFRLSEVAMYPRYLYGVVTTAFVVVGLCMFHHVSESLGDPTANLTVLDI